MSAAVPSEHWNATHGRTRTKEYRAWLHAKDRCYRKNDSRYRIYGARGIKMCDDWRNDFAKFYADMGPAPSRAHTLERKNRNKDYAPDNCIWADRFTQANNTSANVTLNVNGKIMTLAQFARSMGIKYKSFHHYFTTRKLSLEVAAAKATRIGVSRKPGENRFYTADVSELARKAANALWAKRRRA